jgi:signal transduction histidine kinase
MVRRSTNTSKRRDTGLVVSSCEESTERRPAADPVVLLEEDDARSRWQYRHVVNRRNWVFDLALAVVVGVLGQLEAWIGLGATHRQGPLWVQSLLYAITAALLVFRRIRPLGCLIAIVVVSVAEFAVVGSPEGFAVAVPMLIAIYTVSSRLAWRRSWIALALAVVLWVAWAFLDPANEGFAERLGALVWLAPSTMAWLVGSLVRVTRLNTEQRRLNREQRAAQAVAEERSRIARELHDVVGHSVSVMTVQASAVRRRLRPEQEIERRALEAVEETGRDALAEMRRMVSRLRAGPGEPELAPAPGLDQIEQLIGSVRAAGLPVSVMITGNPRALSPGLDVTAYRLVQEGLTNALRHARRPRHAQVSIDYGDEQITLAVRDDGEPAPPGATAGEPGHGLVGMSERVAMYDGSLIAQPRCDGGFELVATLALDAG